MKPEHKTYLLYLWDLLQHKWWVFVECCRLGIPWLGVIHDLSKFHPAEFPHAARRYKGTEEQQEAAKRTYPGAWLHHQHTTKHHWIYWVVYMPIPGFEWVAEWGCIPIPDRYRREMLADWHGAGRRFGKPALVWYTEQRDKILLHPTTRAWLERRIGYGE